MTYSTSAVLPLGAGTWYYRVRGIDYNLPTGVQQMAWSDPEQIVVTKPKLKIVPAAPKKFRIVGAGTKKTLRCATLARWTPTSLSPSSSQTSPTRSRCRASVRPTCVWRRSPT